MSTRAVIAKPDGDSYVGTYHHWDGYPSGLGRTLHDAYREAFAGDVGAMVAKLVDGEPIGWSTIQGYNLELPAEWNDGMPSDETRADWYRAHGPQSYSARGETDGFRCSPDKNYQEWSYVLTGPGIAIYVGSDRAPAAFVRWNESPGWEELDNLQSLA